MAICCGVCFLQHRDFDCVRIQDVGLIGASDAVVLEWAAENRRLVLTHDRATLPHDAFVRVAAGQSMPGVFVVNDRLPAGEVIMELILIAECSVAADWAGRVLFLPL